MATIPSYSAGQQNVKSRNQKLATGDQSRGADNWYQSDQVTRKSIHFANLYGMQLVGNLFQPKSLVAGQSYPAIIVGVPNGAVKEQSANLYATKMAEQGFVTLSFDQVFWGDSQGSPRNAMAPDLYAESFSAAADYLINLPVVDAEKIGVLGICASGSFAISEMKLDPRLKALATVSLTDMGAVARGQRDAMQKQAMIADAAKVRTQEVTTDQPTTYTSGTPEEIGPDSDAMSKRVLRFLSDSTGCRQYNNASNVNQFCEITELLLIE